MRRFTEISAPLEERLAASAFARVADVTLAVLRVRREVGDALENEALTLTLTDAARRALAPGTVTFVALVGALLLRVALVVLVRTRAERMVYASRRAARCD